MNGDRRNAGQRRRGVWIRREPQFIDHVMPLDFPPLRCLITNNHVVTFCQLHGGGRELYSLEES